MGNFQPLEVVGRGSRRKLKKDDFHILATLHAIKSVYQ